MATNRSIIILTPGFASSEDDESCLPMHQSFVRTVSDEFPDLKIIVLAFQYPFRADVYSFYQATVHSFNGRNRGALTKYFLRRKIFKRLATIHSTENIMGVVSFWYGECAFVGKKFCSKNNIPHMCWLLGQDAKKGNKYFRRAPLSANQLIALSDFIQKTVEENYLIRPFKVIAPGINPKHLPLLNLEKDIDIIGVGSLISLKQYNVFLEVIAEIKKQKKNIDAVLIGEGIEKKELINQSENLSLNNNVKLPGALSTKKPCCTCSDQKFCCTHLRTKRLVSFALKRYTMVQR
jgi:glycosyltransferase involved in cell wall biosynthesis